MSSSRYSSLHSSYSSIGQSAVFSHWSELDSSAQDSLLDSLEAMNITRLAQARENLLTQLSAPASASLPSSIEPFPFTRLTNASASSSSDLARWRSLGLEALTNGKIAIILLAGGQGTRLGSSKPKGCFDIGLPSGKSIFELQADRISSLAQLAAPVPWFIMTSGATDAETRQFFSSHDYFGLPSSSVHFFVQSEIPAFSLDGQFILESKGKLALAPNGNGGIFSALADSGALQKMESLGVEYVHVFGVDNVLVKPADPEFMGWAIEAKCDIANKVVIKADPNERVGVMCLRGGLPSIVEYSELPSQSASARSDGGELLYSLANIAQHMFSLSSLKEFAHADLPYHIARKQIPSVDGPVSGAKLELFIFDVFERAKNLRAFAVKREEEFSPVKNATGADSPDTARRDLTQRNRKLIERLGGKAIGEGIIEIDGRMGEQEQAIKDKVAGKTFDLNQTPKLIIQ